MRYLRNRLFRLVPVFFLVTFASFALLNILPGDIVDAILADEDATADQNSEARAELVKEFNLDKPVVVRYFLWLGKFATGDFGDSYVDDIPVLEIILERLPVTLELLLLAQTLAIFIAVLLGVFAAYRANRPVDRWLSATMFAIVAAPPFVIASVGIFFFAVTWKILPAAGYVPFLADPIANLRHFVLPALVVGILEVPILMRVLRVDMIATLQEDYIALAKAKGMSTAHILFRHAMRPSSFTLVTIIGLQFGQLISGAVILETIFALPGIGKLLVDAIDGRDPMIVQGIVALVAVAYVAINLIVDMLYAILDPRVRRREEPA